MDWSLITRLSVEWWMVVVTAAAAIASTAVALVAVLSSRRATRIAAQALAVELDARARARSEKDSAERAKLARSMMSATKAIQSWYVAESVRPDDGPRLRIRALRKFEKVLVDLRFLTAPEDLQLHAWFAERGSALERLGLQVGASGEGLLAANDAASALESDISRWAEGAITGSHLWRGGASATGATG